VISSRGRKNRQIVERWIEDEAQNYKETVTVTESEKKRV